MATLWKHGNEIARIQKTVDKSGDELEGYDALSKRTLLSFRDDGTIMVRNVITCANGYKPPSPWRIRGKFKKGTDISTKVASVVEAMHEKGWIDA